MQQQTDAPPIIFIASDETQQNALVVKPPDPLRWRLSDNYFLTIKLSEVIGRPIKSWKIVDEFTCGRIVAMQFETYPEVDPLLPIPVLESYPLKFVLVMRQYGHHLTNWSPYDTRQWSWYNLGQILIQDIIKASYRLQLLPDERIAFETCLRYTLAAPGGYR